MNQHRRSLQLPPELAAQLAGARDLRPDAAPKVPEDVQKVREVNAFRAHVEAQKKEADDILAVLPADDPSRARLEAYRERLAAAQRKLSSMHAEVLLPVTPRIVEGIERQLEAVSAAVRPASPSPSPG